MFALKYASKSSPSNRRYMHTHTHSCTLTLTYTHTQTRTHSRTQKEPKIEYYTQSSLLALASAHPPLKFTRSIRRTSGSAPLRICAAGRTEDDDDDNYRHTKITNKTHTTTLGRKQDELRGAPRHGTSEHGGAAPPLSGLAMRCAARRCVRAFFLLNGRRTGTV